MLDQRRDFMLNLSLMPNNEGVIAMQRVRAQYPIRLPWRRALPLQGYSAVAAHNGTKGVL